MHEFLLASIGGLFIGAASLFILFGLGRVTGISGIFAQVLTVLPKSLISWQMVFLIGLIGGTALTHFVFDLPIPAPTTAPSWLIIISGLLVGFGTRLGSGCTSGHGVCGIGRLSLRSIVATMLFMLNAAITVFIVRHIIGGTL